MKQGIASLSAALELVPNMEPERVTDRLMMTTRARGLGAKPRVRWAGDRRRRTGWPGVEGAGDGEPKWASRRGRRMRAVVFEEDAATARRNDR